MQARVSKPRDYSQRISNEQPIFCAEKQAIHDNFCIPQRQEQRCFGQAENFKAAEVRAVDSESFRELSATVACATIGPGCLTPFWDA
jgi:hypothetical protein